ncbi:hypothetical protein Dcae01_03000 [Deinococcus caeni]|uniref:Uncharacterized protein n=1 Tax=Deinococcus caeni TaxID=569127 RepID=A0ABP9UFF4_9DEIO
MFVSRCVKHHLRTKLLEYCPQSPFITHVANQCDLFNLWKSPL